jgi:hypothetical protein
MSALTFHLPVETKSACQASLVSFSNLGPVLSRKLETGRKQKLRVMPLRSASWTRRAAVRPTLAFRSISMFEIVQQPHLPPHSPPTLQSPLPTILLYVGTPQRSPQGTKLSPNRRACHGMWTSGDKICESRICDDPWRYGPFPSKNVPDTKHPASSRFSISLLTLQFSVLFHQVIRVHRETRLAPGISEICARNLRGRACFHSCSIFKTPDPLYYRNLIALPMEIGETILASDLGPKFGHNVELTELAGLNKTAR